MQYTDAALIEAVSRNFTIAATLRELGLPRSQGAAYQRFYRDVARLQLSLQHFDARKANFANRRRTPLAQNLVPNSTSNGSNLKKRLLREKVLLPICAICAGTDRWRGAPLTLHLDHKNGDPTDNRLDNLRILCPNCHSQTATWCGRNKRGNFPPKARICRCGAKKQAKSLRCIRCSNSELAKFKPQCAPKIPWPDGAVLLERLRTTTYVALAAELGISDNAIRKHLAKHKLTNRRGRIRTDVDV